MGKVCDFAMEISRSLWLSSALAASAMAFHEGSGGGSAQRAALPAARTTPFDKNTGAVVMTVNKSGGNALASLAHEAKHAFQFETGKLGFNYRTGGPTSELYDIGDEVEAFQRGQLFGANSGANITERWVRNLDSNYDELDGGPLDTNKSLTYKGATMTFGEYAQKTMVDFTMGYNPNAYVVKGWKASLVAH